MRALLRLSAAAAAFSFMVACGGDGDDPPVTPPTSSITLSANTTTASVARGATASFPITVSRTNYTGDVTFSTTGLPAGVTLTPLTLTGGATTGTVQLAIGSTAAAGTSTITLTGTGSNGAPTASTTVTLTILAPAITLVSGPATAAVTQGGTYNVPITITRTNGFTGPVTITATGLPTGVTAPAAGVTIADGSTTGTLTLTAASNATASATPTNITIRANGAAGSGVTEQTSTIALTVNASTTPGITLSAVPATVTLTAGQGTGTQPVVLTLGRQGGFAGDVTLAVSGAPTGVTATVGTTTLSGAANNSSVAITTTAAATPGTYTLTVTGTSGTTTTTVPISLVINAVPGITLTASPTTALTVAQGGSAQSTLTLARQGGFTGDIALTASNLPAGVTVTFAPTSLTGTTTTTVATVNATAAAAAGNYNITLTGTGPAGTNVTNSVTIPITVAVPQGFTVTTTNIAAAQGSTTGTSTVTINRTGGYTGAVSFAVTGLPAGVTVTTPAATTGNTATLTFNVGSGVTLGNSTFTVTATGAGIATPQTTTGTLTVNAVGSGGTAGFRFCADNVQPVWAAYRDGTSGAWTRITAGANNTYSFNLSSSVGAFAYALPDDDGIPLVAVLYYTAAEFSQFANGACFNGTATRTATGTVAGLGVTSTSSSSATIYLGGGSASPQANGAFTITSAPVGVVDLLGVRNSLSLSTFQFTTDRLILRRNLNPPAGGSIGAVLDFDASEAVAPATATYTVTNGTAGATFLASNAFRTSNGLAGALSTTPGSNTAVSVVGVPTSLTQSGDLQNVTVTEVTNGSVITGRLISQFNRDLANRSVTFGPVANAVTYTTTSTTPYARIRGVAPWQTEYNQAVGISYSQATNGRSWSINASRGYFGAAANFDLELPDFSGVTGFNNTWGLVAGVATQATSNVYADQFGTFTVPSEGSASRSAYRSLTITP